MAKIKLQNVPMEAQNENPNLMSNESDILNSSGILDDSGALVGIVHIEAGSTHLEVPATHCTFYIDIAWQSGDIEFHQPEGNDSNKENDTNPGEITLEYDEPTFTPPATGSIHITDTIVKWVGFLGISVVIEYYYEKLNKERVYSAGLGAYTVPYNPT